jgi:hypothetical protein
VFDRIFLVCVVGGAAIAISYMVGPLLSLVEREYELQLNAAFNDQLIEQAIAQREKQHVNPTHIP